MRVVTLLLAAFLAACGGSTGPKAIAPPLLGIDPSVLVINQSADTMRVTFATDRGDSTLPAPPHATTCIRWTQSFDSLYTVLWNPTVADSSPWYKYQWVHFADYPYYFQRDSVRADRLTGAAITIFGTIDQQEC